MNLVYKLSYSSQVLKQLKKMDKQTSKRILDWLKERIPTVDNPRLWGEPLKVNLGKLWRYRIGDFRVICEIRDDELIVLVLQIGHRKEVYDN